MSALVLALMVAAADPDVSKVITNIATNKGEGRAHAVGGYVAGCRGKNRFAFRKNENALEALRPLFTDEDPLVRAAALGLTVCYPEETFENEILSLTEDRDEDVRERAYEEAAHAATPGVAAGISSQVETCAAKLNDLNPDQAKWCVFALYALGENGKAFKDPLLKRRVADLSAPFTVAPQAKLRDHAVRNLELCGDAGHLDALHQLAEGEVKPGGQSASENEKKRAAAVSKKLKGKKRKT